MAFCNTDITYNMGEKYDYHTVLKLQTNLNTKYNNEIE